MKKRYFSLGIVIFVIIVLVLTSLTINRAENLKKDRNEENKIDVVSEIVKENEINPVTSSVTTQSPTTSQVPVKSGPTEIHNTTRAGKLVKDEVWSGQIKITGDILVEEGVTLTILPGTEIIISANSDTNNLFGNFQCDGIDAFDMLKGIKQEDNYNCGVHKGEPFRDEANHISIVVNGTLKATGTENGQISIKSNSASPTIYDWNRLEIHNGVLSYAKVKNYRILETKGNTVELSHNILSSAGECGVCANSGARIFLNNISLAGHEVIDMHNNSPIISNNKIGPNPDKSCITIDGGFPQITGNTIEGCGSGLSLLTPPGDPTLENNILQNNTFSNNGQDVWRGY